jgi:hypothetical protein
VQGGTFHARHELNDADVAHILDQSINDVVAEVAMRHLAAFETQRRFDLVAFAEEAHCLVLFGLIIMLIDGDRKLDFLHNDDFLLLARSAVALVLLVQELSVVLDTADGRDGIGRNFYQVKAALTGDFQCLKWLQNTELVAFVVNDANFTGADLIVDTDE